MNLLVCKEEQALEKQYSYNDKLLIRKMEEITMIYNPENGDMYELNEIGQLVLDKVQFGIPIVKIIEEFSSEFAEDPSVIKQDVEEIFERFINLGIVLLHN